jgi:hypothetical protein
MEDCTYLSDGKEINERDSKTKQVIRNSERFVEYRLKDVVSPIEVHMNTGRSVCLTESSYTESVGYTSSNESSVYAGDATTTNPVFPKGRPSLHNDEFWHSESLRISTDNLFTYSIADELASTVQLASLSIICFFWGIGYEGRLNTSVLFGILETSNCPPVAFGLAAWAYTAFIISNLKLFKILSIGLILIFCVHGTLFAYFGTLMYAYFCNICSTWIFTGLVYKFCSDGMQGRALYVLLCFAGIPLLCGILILLLHLKLWNAILLIIIPSDFIMIELVARAAQSFDCMLYLQMSAIIYSTLFESVRYLSLLGIIEEEMGISLRLARFAAVDLLCIFICKSEILTYIKMNTNCLGKASKTWLLYARIKIACMNVTTYTWPIWYIVFELGRFSLKVDRDADKWAIKIPLILGLNYLPEILGEIAVHIYSQCLQRLARGNYEFGRINFISKLRSSFLLAAYSMIPALFIVLRVVNS